MRMAALTPYLLAGSVVASALGGLVLCLLIVRYGFSAPEDDAPEEVPRRLLLTRLGHAVAAVCFALTALLGAVALGTRPGGTADPDAARLAAEVRALEERVAAVERAVVRVSHSLDRLLDRAERGRPAAGGAPGR